MSMASAAVSSRRREFLGWLRANLFNSPLNAVATVLIVWLALMIVPALIDWAVFDAVIDAPDRRACRAEGSGACWAFVIDKHRLILFGLYPYDEQWRPMIVVGLFVAVILVSANRRFWSAWLVPIWLLGLATISVLMWGGLFGLSYVPTERWGGLPLTLILAFFAIAAGFPLAILLALGRRSTMPAIRVLCATYIELVRGVPLVSLLFMASVMLPLLLPEGLTIDKLLRAQIALIMYTAAYLAEVVRGGLQALPRGQYEAAEALGLGYWRQMGFVILPQALRAVIPPFVNTTIAVFKDTSLVVIIGLYDLMNAAKVAVVDPAWRGSSIEAYVFVALIYFVFCYVMSQYSQSLERRLGKALAG
jgi:general L-amino acid transport system permease protein